MQNTAARHPNDESLVKAVLAGDRFAFATLIEKYEKLVIQIVFRMVRVQADRDDLCQDTFVKVYHKLGGFKFDAKLSTWIGTIAFNTCINYLRKRKIMIVDEISYSTNDEEFTHESGLDQHAGGMRPDEILQQKERWHLLWQCVEALPPIQRTIIGLFHQEELSLNEIAEILNMPVGSVKSYLYRARQSLKTKLMSL